MGLFSKAIYEEYYLEFKCEQQSGDDEAGIINLEAFGNINEENLYFFASYNLKTSEYKNGVYEKILDVLSNFKDKKIKVMLKIKDKEIKNFKIDLDYLSELYNCDELRELELLGWGINKESSIA